MNTCNGYSSTIGLGDTNLGVGEPCTSANAVLCFGMGTQAPTSSPSRAPLHVLPTWPEPEQACVRYDQEAACVDAICDLFSCEWDQDVDLIEVEVGFLVGMGLVQFQSAEYRGR